MFTFRWFLEGVTLLDRNKLVKRISVSGTAHLIDPAHSGHLSLDLIR